MRLLPSRRVCVVRMVLMALASSAGHIALAAGDVISLPPEFESVASPSGQYILELKLRSAANPHAPRATATLFQVASSGRIVVWVRELPHRPRPRFFLVGDGGHVVLLDEWLNVRSDLAVMVIDKKNTILAQYDLETLRAVLAVPISTLPQRAKHGPWIQAPPVINSLGSAVEVAAADRVLSIRLSDGTMSAR